MRPELPFLRLVSEECLPPGFTEIVRDDSVDWLLLYHGCFCGSHASLSNRYTAVTSITALLNNTLIRSEDSKVQRRGWCPCY